MAQYKVKPVERRAISLFLRKSVYKSAQTCAILVKLDTFGKPRLSAIQWLTNQPRRTSSRGGSLRQSQSIERRHGQLPINRKSDS